MGSLHDDMMEDHAKAMRGETVKVLPMPPPKGPALAFVTGSTMYPYTGHKPNDVDIVIPVDEDTKDLIEYHLHIPTKGGRINLILAESRPVYDCWLMARDACVEACTERMLKGRPWTREDAVEIHDKVFEKHGLPRRRKGVTY